MVRTLPVLALCAALAATWPGAAALAASGGSTAQGHRFVTGGIADGERAMLREHQPGSGLWVVTAAQGTGAYLSDVDVAITDSEGNRVLDTKLDGPWLLVDLDPGRYTVTADFGNQKETRQATIGQEGLHRAYFYFRADAGAMPLASAAH
jgi:hypothetical protein